MNKLKIAVVVAGLLLASAAQGQRGGQEKNGIVKKGKFAANPLELRENLSAQCCWS